MISQIVEARPGGPALHLEEARASRSTRSARKETESRIKPTRENLERLNDVREEVEKQHRAPETARPKAAERYQNAEGRSGARRGPS
jgi:chromosome segregation protein